MNPALIQTGQNLAVLLGDTEKNFVSTHFENLYFLMTVFFEDPNISLFNTEEAFSAEEVKAHPTPAALYGWAVGCVYRNHGSGNSLGDHSIAATLCFLLKEIGSFRYNEIAALTGLEPSEVSGNIAEVRSELLKKMA